MTEKRVIMDKKKLNFKESEGRSIQLKRNEMRNQSKKLKQKRKKRLIIRNLSFKVNEEKLKEVFSEFGEVVEANIPLKPDGKKRGFAFIQYKDTISQIKAMKAMNFKEIYGRPIAVDFAMPKTAYQTKNKTYSDSQKMDAESIEANSNSESEDNEKEDVKQKIKEESDSDDNTDDDSNETDENDDDKKVRTFLKEFDAGEEHVNSADESSSDDSSEDEDESNNVEKDSQFSDDIATTSDKLPKKKCSNDVSEGKTVFIRNVCFSSTEENLRGLMGEYGETQYCLLCMDPFTDRPKGTAFVKFKEKESADKFIEESSKDPGILLDGRRLLCAYALSREELSKTRNESPKVTDKRNLRLLKCSVIIPGSKEAEGVSHTDMAKRAKLEIVKKQKLRNTNFFVSDKRLVIHNIPKDITNKGLKTLFKKSAGKGAVIKEIRVMVDLKKTDAQGNPASKGFGFVSFADHEHALKALMELNNNPKIFSSQARPIVEFSVENTMALQSQQRRREKIMMLNKKKIEKNQAGTEYQTEDNNQMSSAQKFTKCKKRIEKNQAGTEDLTEDNNQVSSPQEITKRKRRRGNRRRRSNKKMKQHDVNTSCDKIQTAKSPKEKQKQKKQRRNKNKQGIILNSQDKKTLSVLKNKYKEKLLNKCS